MTFKGGDGDTRPPMRQPRVAELVADELRSQILSGELADGDILPKQDDLTARFGVSQPSIREALFTLESEGLLAVRRGAHGGAIVRRPRADVAAFMTAMVLQSRNTSVADLAESLALLEPMCASRAATLPQADRRPLVSDLETVQQATEDAVGDEVDFTSVARRFHDGIVRGCGLESLALAVGVLDSLWSAHERRWASRTLGEGRYPSTREMEGVVEVHRRILEAIRTGDAAAAENLTRRHVLATQELVLANIRDEPVEALALGPAWARA